MTSAPKSDRIVAALGPAMKLARSTTFSPEKILSVVTLFLLSHFHPKIVGSASLELWCTFRQKCRGAFFLVFRSGAHSEQRSLQQQAFRDASVQSFIDCLNGVLNAERCVCEDLIEHDFCSGDKAGIRNHFIHQADPVRLLSIDDFAGKDELQSPTFSNQSWKALRPAIARHDSNLDFRLAEFRTFGGNSNRRSH